MALVTPLIAQVVANSASDTQILSVGAIPNGLARGSYFSFFFAGQATTAAAAQTLTGWVSLNGTKIASIQGGFAGVVSGQAFKVDGALVVRAIGSSGLVIAYIEGTYFSPPATGSSFEGMSVPVSPTTVDTTSAITLAIGMTWGAAGNSANVDFAAIKREI